MGKSKNCDCSPHWFMHKHKEGEEEHEEASAQVLIYLIENTVFNPLNFFL